MLLWGIICISHSWIIAWIFFYSPGWGDHRCDVYWCACPVCPLGVRLHPQYVSHLQHLICSGALTNNAIAHGIAWITFSFHTVPRKSWLHWRVLWWETSSATGVDVHYWVSCMRCHVFFVSVVVLWDPGRQCTFLGVTWLMVCLTQQRGPNHNSGHSMT